MPEVFDQEKNEVQRDKKAVGAIQKIGNLGRDFELKYSDKGRAYARATLGVTRPVTPGDWKGEKTTDWYDVTAFGSLAENVAECLTKGTRVIVVGNGEIETWISDDGEIHTSRQILADGIGPDLRWATSEVHKVRFDNAKPTSDTAEPEELAF